MQLWKEPSHTYPFLEIPELHFGEHIGIDPILLSLSHIKIETSNEFLDAWHTQTIDELNAEECAKKLTIIGKTLCLLIKQCQPYLSVSHKENELDTVTNVDRGVEMIIRLWLSKHYPSHKIIGEEGFKETLNTKDPIWFIDPIDGTTNYINGKEDITFQIGCIYQGKPFVGFMGLPFKEVYYSIPTASTLPPISVTDPIKLGSEYLPNKVDQRRIFETLLAQFKATPYQVKSIGVNILGLLTGDATLFYKSHVKLWDVIPPMIIVDQLQPNLWDMEIFTPIGSFSPFSNDPTYIAYLNKKHALNCRIGLTLITPKNKPHLKEAILKHYDTLYPYTRTA